MSRLSTGHINACIKDLKKHTEHCIPAFFEENKDSTLSNGINHDPFWANGLFGRIDKFLVKIIRIIAAQSVVSYLKCLFPKEFQAYEKDLLNNYSNDSNLETQYEKVLQGVAASINSL